MEEPSRFARTPTLTIIVTEAVVGVVLLAFALLMANSDTEMLLNVALGAVGGVSIGMALGMARHRRASCLQQPSR